MRGRKGGRGRKGNPNKAVYPCPKCDFVSKSKGGLTQHMNRKHKK